MRSYAGSAGSVISTFAGWLNFDPWRSAPDFHQILVRLSDLGATNQSGKESIYFFSIMDRILAVKGEGWRHTITFDIIQWPIWRFHRPGRRQFEIQADYGRLPCSGSKPPKAPLQTARYCRRLRVGRCWGDRHKPAKPIL
jgi:hypothetical protein